MNVILYVVSSMIKENEEAISLLRSIDCDFVIEHCGESMREMYTCPFIRDEENRPRYGLEGITLYVDRVRQQSTN